MGKTKVPVSEYSIIVKRYKEEKSVNKIAEDYKVNIITIRSILKSQNCWLTHPESARKGEPSQEEKQIIIDLYVNQKRGAQYIGGLFGRADTNIALWLQKWGIPKISRSDLCKKNREVYGPTKGFTGRTHTKKSKLQIKKSGIEQYLSSGRETIYSPSKYYNTVIGKVSGKYEVAYLQNLLETNRELPTKCRKRIKTPHGTYLPDFEFADRYIEVKSEYTLLACKGKIEDSKGNYSDKQWKKIKYVSKYIKKVEVVVLKNKDQTKLVHLFKRAGEIGGILCCAT